MRIKNQERSKPMRIKNAKPKLPTREEGLHRLMLVANKLAKMPKLPTEKSPGFNYDQWGPQFWNGDETLCGSSCCVLGLGTTIPVLRKAGLRMVQPAFPWPSVHVSLAHRLTAGSCEAAQEVFALSLHEAEYLFYSNCRSCFVDSSGELLDSPSEYALPMEVAEHVRRFVAWVRKKEGIPTPPRNG